MASSDISLTMVRAYLGIGSQGKGFLVWSVVPTAT